MQLSYYDKAITYYRQHRQLRVIPREFPTADLSITGVEYDNCGGWYLGNRV